MKIERINEEFPWTTVPRSPGLHLTDIIDDVLQTLNMAVKYNEGTDPRLQYEKGYLWEVVLSQAFSENVAHRIGEIEMDGIICTPDSLSWDGKNPIVEEYKCTAKSSVSSPGDNVRWMMQAKGYCKVLESNSCIFRILYLCGNYRDIRSPQYFPYLIDFSQTEIDENWLSIVNHAKMREWL